MTTEYSSIESLKRHIIKVTQEWYSKGLEKFPQERLDVEISFTLSGRVAGKAHTRHTSNKHWIEYNLGLAYENPEVFLNDTVPHEVTHLIANTFFHELCPTGCGHNELWAFTVRKLGLEPHQFHRMPITDSSKEISRNARKLDADFV